MQIGQALILDSEISGRMGINLNFTDFTMPRPALHATLPPARDSATSYLESLQILERLHRLLQDLVKDEFERLGHTDLTPVQGLILYNLGSAIVSAGELRSRGIYQGSNVSYNLKRLVQLGYVSHERSDTDRRSIRVRLTVQGNMIRDVVATLFLRHAEGLEMSGILDDPPVEQVNLQWRRIERFWGEQIRYIY